MDERLRFVARLLDGERMAALLFARAAMAGMFQRLDPTRQYPVPPLRGRRPTTLRRRT